MHVDKQVQAHWGRFIERALGTRRSRKPGARGSSASSSVWDAPGAARALVAGWRGSVHVARLEIREDAPIMARQTLKPGHYTLRGTPDASLACAVSLESV